MDLFTILTIPENMNPQSPSLKKLWWFVKLGKILKNSLIWTFFAIILALGQKNPKFLYFLNPYTCPNLGQGESQKLRSNLVITLVVLCRALVLRFIKKLHSTLGIKFQIFFTIFIVKGSKPCLWNSESCNFCVYFLVR